MIAVAFRPVELVQIREVLSVLTFWFLVFAVIYFVWRTLFGGKSSDAKRDNLTKEQWAEGLRLLREFTNNGPRISSWLKEHEEELQRYPTSTLNNQEFINLINRDQALYERILEIYPDYPNTVMPPKELRQYFIELAQGQHRQTH